MKKYLLCFFFLLPVLAQAGSANLRIGTYNLRMAGLDKKSPENCWTAREPRLVQSFLREQFDICALQEVDSAEQERVPALLEEAGMNYGSYFFSPYSQDGKGPKGQGVIWRRDRFLAGEPHYFWLSEPADSMQVNDFWRKSKFKRGGFCMIFTDLQNKGARYFVMVTHAPLSKEDHVRGAHIYIDMERRYNPEGLPSFFLGDMNANEDHEASATYRSYWNDSYRYFDGRPSHRTGPAVTFNGWDLSLNLSPETDRRIDFIYYRGPGVKPLCYECDTTRFDGLYASDHFPVFVDFEVDGLHWTDFNKNGRMDVYEDPSAPVEERVEDLLSQMTLEEKTCQMVTLYGYRRVLQDQLPTQEWKNKLWKDGIGAIDEHLNSFVGWNVPLSTESPYIWPASKHAWALNEVQRFFVEQTRLGIPVDFTNEGIRGVEAYKATNFPTQLGLGSTWDKDLIEEVGRITGAEARLLGYTNVYAPILDVGRDQRWGRYEEIYGEDPFLVAELGIRMVRGLQEDGKVAATAKHYAIYSAGKGAREGMARCDPHESPLEVENIHMYPWRRVVREAGLLGAMSSYNDYNGEPVQGSRYWLTDRLRSDFGFRGYVVSDSDAVEYLHSKHHTASDMKESVRQSVEAGLNVRCTFRSPDSYVLPLRELVREGTVSMATIDERVRDVLRVKFLVGLFDHPYVSEDDMVRADAEVNGPGHNEVALRASLESLVLLKNDGVLPLDGSKLRRVAVIGPNADEDGYAHVHYGPQATESVTVYQGLKTALAGKAEVVYARGCPHVDSQWPDSEVYGFTPTKEELAGIREAVKAVRRSDVAVLVLGGNLRTCGENRSRTSLDLPPVQQLLVQEVKKTGRPLVLVLINGRPLTINKEEQAADAVLEAWYPGAHGGTAVAMALLGQYNPGGKLTVTFPRTVGQIPYNFPYKPGSQVDGYVGLGPEGKKTRASGCLYPFGYGLSYTSFEYSALRLSADKILPGEELSLSFELTNTGKYPGDEVVQLYLNDKVSSITVYEKLLRGFERVHLEPGETKTVRMKLPPEAFEMLNLKMERVVEPGLFDIYVGSSSEDFRLGATVTVLDPADPSRCFSTAPAALAGLLPASLSAGDEITIPLNSGVGFHKCEIDWRLDSRCRYRILINQGGGQFAPVMDMSTAGGLQKPRFDQDYKASDIKIQILEGRGTVTGFDCLAL